MRIRWQQVFDFFAAAARGQAMEIQHELPTTPKKHIANLEQIPEVDAV
jgi:hypothetical protein